MVFPYSLVIFDCDGTLIDTGTTEQEVFVRLLAEQEIAVSVEEFFETMFGVPSSVTWDTFAVSHGATVTPALKQRHSELTYEAFRTATEAVPGVQDVIAKLKAKGVPICVASNGAHSQMKLTLGAAGLLEYFKGALFSADDVKEPKPAPDLFLYAAKKMKVDPLSCAVVEDSARGVQAGIEAGMSVFQFTGGGYSEPVAHPWVRRFEAMSELPGLLGL